MKKLYLLTLLSGLFICNLFSQAPQYLNYQAIVRDNGGNLISNHSVSLRISLLQASIYGTTVYSETHTIPTNLYGLVSLEIGNGTILTGTFSTINWNSGPYFLKVDLDPLGGSSYSEMGFSQILSVPYALHAETVENFSETDPLFSAHATNGITGNDITNWNSTFSWGDHSLAGYITGFTETDPLFGAHVANSITGNDITNWNSAFGWGDHSLAGYLTAFTEMDPVFGAHVTNSITGNDIALWNDANSWGDHSLVGYLTGFTETDPVFSAHVVSGISTGDITNWNMAYSWGNHTAAGYGLLAAPNIWLADQMISHPGSPRLIIQDINSLQSFIEFHDAGQNNGYIVFNHANHNLYLGNRASGPQFEWIFTGDGRLVTPGDIESAGIVFSPGGNSNQWNTAFSWGNHAGAGYLTVNSTLNGLVQSDAVGDSYFTGGNVGIGTSTPGAKLQVAGNLMVENNTIVTGTLSANDITASGGNFDNISANNMFSSPLGTVNDLSVSSHLHAANAEIDDVLTVGTAFEVSGVGNLVYRTDVLFANTSGNVGIGTSSPTEKLSVEGIVQSTSGGFRFPDGTVQQTAAPVIKHGKTNVGVSIGPYSYFTVSVSFGYAFTSPPTVTVTGYNAAGTQAARLIPSVYSVSTTQFMLVLYNSFSAGYGGGYSVNWIAVGN